MAAIVPVVGDDTAVGQGPAEGKLAALKLARPEDPLSVEALQKEIVVFEALCRAPGEPPCPRLFDVIDRPGPGLVMEWCPTDLERWWAGRHADRDAIPALCEALAAVCRRVREYAVVSEMELGRRVVHADIKPRNVLLSASGRWLLTDFGAAKSRAVDEESWVATRMIIGTENYIAPETLFNARKAHPAALDTWSIGCTLFALLRMRSLLRGGGKLPPNGTHSHHFRTHRTALVADLQLRQPARFADRDLDPSAFPSPDRLPDKDRAAIEDALRGLYDNPHLEARLCTDVTNLLDRALLIDPARRYTDPIEMAGDFEALATRARELALRSAGGATGPRSSTPTIWPPAAAPAVPPAEPAPRGGGAGRLALALGGGAAVLGVAGIVVAVLTGIVVTFLLKQTEAPPTASGVAPAAPASAEVAPATAPAAAAPAAPAPEGAAPAAAGGAGGATTTSPASPSAPKKRAPTPEGSPTGEGTAAPARRPTPPPAAATPPAAAADDDEEAEEESELPRGHGELEVLGAEAYLMGRGGKKKPGVLPKGKYELFVRVDGAWVSQGETWVEEGALTTWRCGFGTCREDLE